MSSTEQKQNPLATAIDVSRAHRSLDEAENWIKLAREKLKRGDPGGAYVNAGFAVSEATEAGRLLRMLKEATRDRS